MKPPGWVFGGAPRPVVQDATATYPSDATTTAESSSASNSSEDTDNSSETKHVVHLKVPDSSDADLWSEKLVNPLDIRFSQKTVHPCFDKHGAIEAQVDFIEQREIDGGIQLITPFPMIRLLEIGPNQYVSLDNRRLYCLQRAAVNLHPEKCFIYCLVTPRLPRHKRKTEFRKFTAGKLGDVKISIESKHGVHSVWNWNEAIYS